MSTIVEENKITFKELEQTIYRFVCGIGQEMTRIYLENLDDELAKESDRGKYRDKEKRMTTIKTVYGEEENRRIKEIYKSCRSMRQTAKEAGCSLGHVQDVIHLKIKHRPWTYGN